MKCLVEYQLIGSTRQIEMRKAMDFSRNPPEEGMGFCWSSSRAKRSRKWLDDLAKGIDRIVMTRRLSMFAESTLEGALDRRRPLCGNQG